MSVEEVVRNYASAPGTGRTHNINFVTPTHYADKIVQALERIRGGRLTIPTVYNSSGYETAETLAMLNGYIDVYLPDLKYMSPALSARYSSAEDYFLFASSAITLMQRADRRARLRPKKGF